jgi:hypothetical protein
MSQTEEKTMTIEELHDSLPAELQVTAETLPAGAAEAIAYLAACNELRDASTPEIPSIEEWRSARGQ